MTTDVPPRLCEAALVLGQGVDLAPVRELPASLRRKLAGREDDVVISRRGVRSNSRLVDAEAADFVSLFREPRTLVDAVIAFAAKVRGDPLEILDEAYPFVIQLRKSGLVVTSDSGSNLELQPRYGPATVIHGFTIIRCVQFLTDSEVYKATVADGREVALKCLRIETPGKYLAALKREQEALRCVASNPRSPAPALVAVDLKAEPPYLATQWCIGRKIMEAVQGKTRQRRARVAAAVIEAYAKLHESGWLHGDVHPKNLLVSKDGRVALFDFGEARPIRGSGQRRRRGVVPFHEPELASAILQRRVVPAVSPAGEQYAVATLAYEMLTAIPCIDLALDRVTALRQIAESPPRTFGQVGADPWPAVEAVLLRALSKKPSCRYPTMRRFANAFRRATLRRAGTSPRRAPVGMDFDAGINKFLSQYGLLSHALDLPLPCSPTASAYYGACGIAYSLLRIGQLRSDSRAAAAANIWIRRARKDIECNPKALENPDLSVTTAKTGPIALFHRETGVHTTEAMICHALGDPVGMEAAIQRFLDAMPDQRIQEATCNPELALDATRGPPSLILGSALLLPLWPSMSKKTARALRTTGDALCARVLRSLGSPPGPGALPPSAYFGFAHGWVGALFALLRWSEATGKRPPEVVREHLDALAAHGIPMATGLAWPIFGSKPSATPWPGWCHGSAGYVFVWSLAARSYSEGHYVDLAIRSGEHCWSCLTASDGSLCCGRAGRALAMFELECLVPGHGWRKRADAMGGQALRERTDERIPHSLFKGGVGPSLVAAEILYAQEATLPFCHAAS